MDRWHNISQNTCLCVWQKSRELYIKRGLRSRGATVDRPTTYHRANGAAQINSTVGPSNRLSLPGATTLFHTIFLLSKKKKKSLLNSHFSKGTNRKNNRSLKNWFHYNLKCGLMRTKIQHLYSAPFQGVDTSNIIWEGLLHGLCTLVNKKAHICFKA